MRRTERSPRWPTALALVVVIALATAVGISPTSAPAGPAPTWKIVASPNARGTQNGSLVGVACPGSTICFAVGSSIGLGGALDIHTLIEQWNGSSWSVVLSPDAKNASINSLDGVACTSETNCFAVGTYQPAGQTPFRSLIERWDGTAWSIMPSPNLLEVQLHGIACAAVTSCFAVGTGSDGAVIMQWNGTQWSTLTAPPNASTHRLLGVTCTGVSTCFAVGRLATNDTSSTLVERWDGVNWSDVPSPTPKSAFDSELGSVACAATTDCFAVGNSGTTALLEHWDGSTWTLTPSPQSSAHRLQSVACGNASSCLAVGGSRTGTWSIRWNGTAWSPIASPNPSGVNAVVGLAAVGCFSSTNCAAVGNYTADARAYYTLAERWDGTHWSLVPSATPERPTSGLSDVSCLSPTNCFAVGHSFPYDADHDAALIEHWDGTKWSIIANATEDPRLRRLFGVACANATRCFAVGSENYRDFADTLVLQQWDGTKMSAIEPTTPDSSSTRNGFFDVACASPTRCFAVGYYGRKHAIFEPLVERWDGKIWSQQGSPNPTGSPSSALDGVACPGPTTCFAAGYTLSRKGYRTLVEQWNGSGWSIMASPHPGTFSALSSVSCATVSSCFAVGSYGAGAATKLLIERWDGTAWKVVSGANPPAASSSRLSQISCPGISSCVALGISVTGGTTKSLMEKWDGSRWAIVSFPTPSGASSNILSGITCPTISNCIAVGESDAGSFTRATLIERYS